MDIEHYIYFDYLIKKYKVIPVIINIINRFIGTNGDYNLLIENHILHQTKLSKIVALELDQEYNIKENLLSEIFIKSEHLHFSLHPEFIFLNFNYSPQIDYFFCFSYQCDWEDIILKFDPISYIYILDFD